MSIQKRVLFVPSLALLAASVLASGCNTDSAGSSAGLGAQDNSQLHGGGNNVAAGESCVSNDPNQLCLAIHFVTYKDNAGTPVADEKQAAKIVAGMNRTWSQCNIAFQIDQYDAVDPTAYGLSYGAQSENELNSIRNKFSQPSNQLLSVTTGPWSSGINGWTNMPGGGPYGAIMEASIVDYADGAIYSHEFGHYLGLDHVSGNQYLMSPSIYTSPNTITDSECQTARATANSDWVAMLRK
jgi:hypothetical protein